MKKKQPNRYFLLIILSSFLIILFLIFLASYYFVFNNKDQQIIKEYREEVINIDSKKKDWKIYLNNDNSFILSYPSNWSIYEEERTSRASYIFKIQAPYAEAELVIGAGKDFICNLEDSYPINSIEKEKVKNKLYSMSSGTVDDIIFDLGTSEEIVTSEKIVYRRAAKEYRSKEGLTGRFYLCQARDVYGENYYFSSLKPPFQHSWMTLSNISYYIDNTKKESEYLEILDEIVYGIKKLNN